VARQIQAARLVAVVAALLAALRRVMVARAKIGIQPTVQAVAAVAHTRV
jgi:hypothetical protein